MMRLFPHCALAALLTLGVASARAGDKEKFQGHWRSIAYEVGSKDVVGGVRKSIEITVKGDKLTFEADGAKPETYHIKLHEQKGKPDHIDFHPEGGKGGAVFHGIYHFDGKDLKMAWGPAGADRPKSFSATDNNQHRNGIFKKK